MYKQYSENCPPSVCIGLIRSLHPVSGKEKYGGGPGTRLAPAQCHFAKWSIALKDCANFNVCNKHNMLLSSSLLLDVPLSRVIVTFVSTLFVRGQMKASQCHFHAWGLAMSFSRAETSQCHFHVRGDIVMSLLLGIRDVTFAKDSWSFANISQTFFFILL